MLIVPPPSPEITRGLSATLPLLLRGPRLPDGRIADVMVTDGVIVSVGDDSAGRPPSHVMDLRGYLLLPSLAEPHAHLRLTAPVPRPGEAGGRTAADRDRWVAAPADLAPTDVATRAWNGAARYLAAGTTAIRVHVDIGQECGLRAVEALLEVRAGLAVVVPRPAPGWPGAVVPGSSPGSAVVRELLAAGVPIAAGGDGSLEPSGPADHADPLGTAADLVAARLTPAEAIAAISAGGRQIMRLPAVAVVPGSPADLVAIRAPDLWDAVTSRAADRIVLRGGRVVARNIAADLARQEQAVTMAAWN